MKTIDKNIDINNLYLISLPEWMGEIDIVNGDFNCCNNQLTSLEGCPEVVYRDFYCWNNPGKFTEEDVRKVCKVRGEIYY
jgi:hypothetical protein